MENPQKPYSSVPTDETSNPKRPRIPSPQIGTEHKSESVNLEDGVEIGKPSVQPEKDEGKKEVKDEMKKKSINDPTICQEISACKQMLQTDPISAAIMMEKILFTDLGLEVPASMISTSQMLSQLRDIVFSKPEHFMDDLPKNSDILEAIKKCDERLSSRSSVPTDETSNPKRPRIPSPQIGTEHKSESVNLEDGVEIGKPSVQPEKDEGKKEVKDEMKKKSINDPTICQEISACKQMLQTDPISAAIMMEKILFTDLGLEVPASMISTSQMLSQLRDIVFSKPEHFMDDLPKNSDILEAIKKCDERLSSRIDDMTIEQTIGFHRFVEFFHATVMNIDNRKEIDHSLKVSRFRHNCLSLDLQASEDKAMKVGGSLSAEQDKIDNITQEIGELKLKLKLLEKQRNLLHRAHMKPKKEKEKIDKEVEEISAERTRVWNEILECERKEKKFVADYDVLRKTYEAMNSNPPF